MERGMLNKIVVQIEFGGKHNDLLECMRINGSSLRIHKPLVRITIPWKYSIEQGRKTPIREENITFSPRKDLRQN